MFQNLKRPFHCYCILCMHLYAYILLSFKVIVPNIFQNCYGGHIGFKGLDGLKLKKIVISVDLSSEKIVELDILCFSIACLVIKFKVF